MATAFRWASLAARDGARAQRAITDLAKAMRDSTGNLPPLPGMFPDYPAPIVRSQADGRELAMAR
jgi:hypothetical protein